MTGMWSASGVSPSVSATPRPDLPAPSPAALTPSGHHISPNIETSDRHPADRLATPEPAYLHLSRTPSNDRIRREEEHEHERARHAQQWAVDPEAHHLAQAVRRKRKGRHRYCDRGGSCRHAWLKKKKHRKSCGLAPGYSRHKVLFCIISGLFLATILSICTFSNLTLPSHPPAPLQTTYLPSPYDTTITCARRENPDLSLVLLHPSLGSEIHVLFVLLLLASTIFFLHSLITLLIHYLRPDDNHHHPHRRRRHHGAIIMGDGIPVLVGPQGYEPDVPIPVILARDEEVLAANGEEEEEEEEEEDDDDNELDTSGGGRNRNRGRTTPTDQQPETTTVLDVTEKPNAAGAPKAPPPAYGLWRSSVRLNPGLLHWAKAPEPSAEEVRKRETIARLGNYHHHHHHHHHHRRRRHNAVETLSGQRRSGSGAGRTWTQRPRPPSYVSDDGVEYVVAAAPTLRGTALFGEGGSETVPGFEIREMGTGEVHPALRDSGGDCPVER
ncbi:hypothetical protein LTS18_007712 [Coniosporium uncinatum]|uniref:Uncharacterized protein n=1 Tax=Coniosporium uncinatum TaxID=93489 RepID=A0ACC3DPA2_9PEZI|nr:hypothetical protein LTS18_007712 [Coniosporium uncinatum]